MDLPIELTYATFGLAQPARKRWSAPIAEFATPEAVPQRNNSGVTVIEFPNSSGRVAIPLWPAVRSTGSMPELSRFYGIVIRMYVEAGAPHHRPHFHAYYQNASMAVAIDNLEVLGGELPTPQRRLVEAWGELHRGELFADWALLQSGSAPVKIDPLR
jgi:hypothetical protein